MSIPILVSSEKSIPVPVRWSDPDRDEGGWIRFQVPLDIDGITETILVLEGGTYSQHPDRNVCFELCLLGLGRNRRIPLIRVEWRSIRGGHTNQRRSRCSCKVRRVPETHIHPFEDNWLPDQKIMKRGDLPCAEPIKEDLQSFESLRDYVGTRFRINNISIVPRPLWQYTLDLG
jgi:hypothetical protein